MPARICSTNHRWNSGPVSIAPPPTINASGAKGLIISSKKTPSACAWKRKTSRQGGLSRAVAPLVHAPPQFGALPRDPRGLLVIRVAREQVRQQGLADRGEGPARFEVAR